MTILFPILEPLINKTKIMQQSTYLKKRVEANNHEPLQWRWPLGNLIRYRDFLKKETMSDVYFLLCFPL